ncbi:glutaredoxin family protein [Rufibacter quisquiliarum]|uniref:Mycoredoxin n=1 Tax=Rufibacter quisquiliarum TaxID=1549639 RepID=A0A839GAZ5_9BACT|nr:glutaredoxin domain-containing protein [Rufibacter quisquiliarum]MBA9075470.1 mycoredoxin [Rufibacter quisquiliarum]
MAAIPLLYGADWCKKTIAIQSYFQEHGVAYDYLNVEQSDAALQAIKDMNRGKVRFPMVVVGELPPMKNPSPDELTAALAQNP